MLSDHHGYFLELSSSTSDEEANKLSNGVKNGERSVSQLFFSLDKVHGTWHADAVIYIAHVQ